MSGVASVELFELYTKNETGGKSIDFKKRVKSGGYVIYKKEDGETDEQAMENISDDLETAKRNRNQYVWIPLTFQELNQIFEIRNGVLGSRNWKADAFSYTWTSSQFTSYKLKNLIPNLNGILYETKEEFGYELLEEFFNMVRSVATYGGFYIGRYETGNLSQKIPVIRKGNNNISNVNWINMYKRNKNIESTNKCVQTRMIWSVLWDITLNWIVEQKEKSLYETAKDSKSWGNYNSNIIPTRYK